MGLRKEKLMKKLYKTTDNLQGIINVFIICSVNKWLNGISGCVVGITMRG